MQFEASSAPSQPCSDAAWAWGENEINSAHAMTTRQAVITNDSPRSTSLQPTLNRLLSLKTAHAQHPCQSSHRQAREVLQRAGAHLHAHRTLDCRFLRPVPPWQRGTATKQTRARANKGTARTKKGLGHLITRKMGDETPRGVATVVCKGWCSSSDLVFNVRRSQDGQGQDVRGCGATLSVVGRPETQYSPVCSISCLDTSPAGIQARPVSTPARLLLRSPKTGHIARITLPLHGPAKQTCRPDSSYSGSRPVAPAPGWRAAARRIACSIPNSQDPPKRGDSGAIDWNFVGARAPFAASQPARLGTSRCVCLDWWMEQCCSLQTWRRHVLHRSLILKPRFSHQFGLPADEACCLFSEWFAGYCS